MGRTKQIAFLATALILLVSPAFCFDVTWEYESEVNERLEKLEIYFETGMYSEARTLLQELITQFPDEARFGYLQAIVDYQLGDYQQAEYVLARFTEEYPDVPEPYYLLSEINTIQGQAKKAKDYLAQYCLLVPDDFQAEQKLQAMSAPAMSEDAVIMQNGKEDSDLVQKLGFYGACVHSREGQALKLINGSFRTWSCMGMDFSRPLDLRQKQIVLTIKGKQGGEKLELTFRDKFAASYDPQLVIVRDEGLSDDWKRIIIRPKEHPGEIDLSNVTHIGLEFGFATVQNPAQSTLYVKDISIEDADN